MSHEYSEDQLIQKVQPNCWKRNSVGSRCMLTMKKHWGATGTLGRRSYKEVLLTRYLKEALRKLNPWMTDSQEDEAVERWKAICLHKH